MSNSGVKGLKMTDRPWTGTWLCAFAKEKWKYFGTLAPGACCVTVLICS